MDEYVGLNVGGKIYLTSRSTLLRYPDSFFGALLSESVPSTKDNQGNYVIDRDGDIFRHILNFLRHGDLTLPDGFKEFLLLEREADFFLLSELKTLIKESGKGVTLVFDDGKVFHTTRETLMMREKDSFFVKMLSGKIKVAKDQQGRYIMDRDGRLFHYIMEYLRGRDIFSEIKTEDMVLLIDLASDFERTELYMRLETRVSDYGQMPFF